MHWPAQVGDEAEIKKDMVVRPFPTVHRVPSQGYLVVRRKKQLKQEFVDAGKDAIISAKKNGVEINDFVEVCPLQDTVAPQLDTPAHTSIVC